MHLIFNELSALTPCKRPENAYNVLSRFSEVYETAESFGFKGVKFNAPFDSIRLTDDMSLNDIQTIPSFRHFYDYMLTLATYPMIEPNSETEHRFAENDFHVVIEDKKIMAYGLGTAYLYETMCISFSHIGYWDKHYLHELIITGTEEGRYTVLAISSPGHYNTQEFVSFISQHSPVVLRKCNLSPEKKPMHLREDHGKDKLKELWERLRNSPYVCALINSTPYKPTARNFIDKVKSNGQIEIVLTDTDKGLGIVIQTTGTNRKETEEIANILEQKYS